MQTDKKGCGGRCPPLKFIKRHLNDILTVTACILAVALIYILDIYCPIRKIFGITCPGCGMTRALLCALRFDFAAAFSYHPLFFTVPILGVLFIFKDRLRPRTVIVCSVILLGLFIAVYIIRYII